jgi:F-type H+-transporting ATPase subunit epsilon
VAENQSDSSIRTGGGSFLRVSILSPERRLLEDGKAQWLTLPGSEGQIQVLPGHAAMVGTLRTGSFTYVGANGQEEAGFISTGFFEVKDDSVVVLAETIELKGEIDLARAKAAQAKAEAALVDANLDEHRFNKYQLKLQRAIVRQHLSSSG